MRPIRLIVESGAHWHEGCRCNRGGLQVGGTASKWMVLGNVIYFVSELPEAGFEVAIGKSMVVVANKVHY